MTAYRSESRNLMYTAPPSGDDEVPNRPESEASEEHVEDAASEADDASATDEEAADERASHTVEPASATTDANWTGTIPADD